MELKLVVQIFFANGAKKALEQDSKTRHDDPPSGRAKRATMPAILSQFSASVASCFFPALVME
jgi:hypothetical protein